MAAASSVDLADELQRELDQLAAALGRSVSLDDPTGTLLGYSAQGTDVDPVRIAAILARHVPAAVQDYQRRYGIETATGPIALPGNAELNMLPRLCLPILRGTRRLGYLWILTDQTELDPTDLAIAAESARHVRGILQTRSSRPDDRPATDRAFADLLAHPADSGDFINALARTAPHAVQSPVRFAVAIAATVDQDERRPADPDPLLDLGAPIALALHRTPALIAAHVMGDRIAGLLVGTGRPGTGPTGLASTLTRWESEDRFFVVATSPPARLDDNTFAGQYARTSLAGEIACFDPSLPTQLSWADLGIYQLLLTTTRPDAWGSAHTALDDEAAAGAPLRHTLERYLDLGGDAGRTAASLHIHRTSLYYRLRKATQLLGADLENGIVRTQIHTSMKARRLARARTHFQWTPAWLDSIRS